MLISTTVHCKNVFDFFNIKSECRYLIKFILGYQNVCFLHFDKAADKSG